VVEVEYIPLNLGDSVRDSLQITKIWCSTTFWYITRAAWIKLLIGTGSFKSFQHGKHLFTDVLAVRRLPELTVPQLAELSNSITNFLQGFSNFFFYLNQLCFDAFAGLLDGWMDSLLCVEFVVMCVVGELARKLGEKYWWVNMHIRITLLPFEA